MGEDEYVCTLDAASIAVAREELYEDPDQRQGAIESLREWIQHQKHLTFTTDTRTLLAYLRYAKFSQLKARHAIENHVTAKVQHPSWFNSFDPFDPHVTALVKSGYILPLPGYDSQGRKRLLYRGVALDPVFWKSRKAELIRALYTAFYYVLRDERCQVNGLVYLCDQSNQTFAHKTFWRVEELTVLMRYWQNTVPTRFKAFHMYNCGPIWEAFYVILRPFLSVKLKSRIIMAGANLPNLYEVFPQEILPVEYLPDDYTGQTPGTLDQMTDAMLVDMRRPEMVEFLSLISHVDWKIDTTSKQENIPNESFRKLNVS